MKHPLPVDQSPFVGATIVSTTVPAIHPRQLTGGVGDQQKLLRRLPNFDLHEVLTRPEIRTRVHWHFYGRSFQVLPPRVQAAFVGDDAVTNDVVPGEFVNALQLRLFLPWHLSDELRIVPVYQLQPHHRVSKSQAMKMNTNGKREDDE